MWESPAVALGRVVEAQGDTAAAKVSAQNGLSRREFGQSRDAERTRTILGMTRATGLVIDNSSGLHETMKLFYAALRVAVQCKRSL